MNESPTQDAPAEDADPSAEPAPGPAPDAGSTAPGETSQIGAQGSGEIIAEDPPIAPGVPRMGRPVGTARAIPETILGPRPSPMFLAVVAIVSLFADIASKLWAEKRLEGYPGYVNVIDDHLMFVLAKNKGGAWGLLQGQSENVRRPFFLLVSVAAIAFIVTLYRRLLPNQHALKWGLPLVLGGALGNVFDRIRYGYVIDFIDYRADWIRGMNELIQKYVPDHVVTDHWPTFNVADVAICVGVGLMAIDMLTTRRGKKVVTADVPVEAEPIVEEPAAATEAAEAPAADGAPGEAPAAEVVDHGPVAAGDAPGAPAAPAPADAPAKD
jgi:signal peptidase II